ncbi:MAG: NAD+ synthase [Actinomycetota bacterium]|nr:NAD+ synthase [Actinomycetota bacterium]
MVRFALAQLNQVVGDIDGNLARLLEAASRAAETEAQILVVPELAITGYPPEDLFLKASFLKAARRALEDFAAKASDVTALIGCADPGPEGLYNAVAVCHGGRVAGVYHKHLLPNYGVFDEPRYFMAGTSVSLIDTPIAKIGICICEDAWFPTGPVAALADAGAQVIAHLNASVFHKGKVGLRNQMLRDHSERYGLAIVYVNLVGGQDELVFDGGSTVISQTGEILARLPQFTEAFEVVDVPIGSRPASNHGPADRISFELRSGPVRSTDTPIATELTELQETYEALKLGLADYVRKNGFSRVVIGLSGGLDSALTATIAVDALGAEDVLTIALPAEHSTAHSLNDARELARRLGIELLEIPIADVYRSFMKEADEILEPEDGGLAEENLQARIRGILLMFVSNRYGHLVLATGNKSEMACGYATLYGDMVGAFALLKDVYKTEVYELARLRNAVSEVIPASILTKPPSAELRPHQKDTDSLPAYEILDPILQAYIERNEGVSDLVAAGIDANLASEIITLVDRAEYKRRQAPPGPKVTAKAFGRDRRLPITNRWREPS